MKIQVPYLKFRSYRDEDALFRGVERLLKKRGKYYCKPYKHMLKNARDVMANGQDVVWDFDREPPVPACRVCGGWLIQAKQWKLKGKKEWVCSFKYRYPSWHRLMDH